MQRRRLLCWLLVVLTFAAHAFLWSQEPLRSPCRPTSTPTLTASAPPPAVARGFGADSDDDDDGPACGGLCAAGDSQLLATLASLWRWRPAGLQSETTIRRRVVYFVNVEQGSDVVALQYQLARLYHPRHYFVVHLAARLHPRHAVQVDELLFRVKLPWLRHDRPPAGNGSLCVAALLRSNASAVNNTFVLPVRHDVHPPGSQSLAHAQATLDAMSFAAAALPVAGWHVFVKLAPTSLPVHRPDELQRRLVQLFPDDQPLACLFDVPPPPPHQQQQHSSDAKKPERTRVGHAQVYRPPAAAAAAAADAAEAAAGWPAAMTMLLPVSKNAAGDFVPYTDNEEKQRYNVSSWQSDSDVAWQPFPAMALSPVTLHARRTARHRDTAESVLDMSLRLLNVAHSEASYLPLKPRLDNALLAAKGGLASVASGQDKKLSLRAHASLRARVPALARDKTAKEQLSVVYGNTTDFAVSALVARHFVRSTSARNLLVLLAHSHQPERAFFPTLAALSGLNASGIHGRLTLRHHAANVQQQYPSCFDLVRLHQAPPAAAASQLLFVSLHPLLSLNLVEKLHLLADAGVTDPVAALANWSATLFLPPPQPQPVAPHAESRHRAIIRPPDLVLGPPLVERTVHSTDWLQRRDAALAVLKHSWQSDLHST